MSHEIGKMDKQQGLTQAWHGLTEIHAVLLLATCWLAVWDVQLRSLWRKLANGEMQETDECEIVCTDAPDFIVGKVVNKNTYSLFTNKAFLAIVQDALNRINGAVVATVGSVCNRGRIFVTLQVPEIKSFLAAGREFKPYLNFLSSHDKSAPFVVNLSTVCTVCNNTFGSNLHDEDNKALRISVRHTSGMEAMLADVPAIIEAYHASIQRFAEVMNQLAQIPIGFADARNFFAGFLTEKDQDSDKTEKEKSEVSSRRMNQIDRLCELFATGKGNKGKDLSDVFSAITDYYSHESSGGEDAEKQFASSEFGNGQTMKAFAFAVMQDDERIAKLIAKGEKVVRKEKKA
jgi:hypothetical protein